MAVPVSDLQAVAPSAIIELFELELNTTQHGVSTTYRFHAGTSLNANGELVWAGNNYQRFPLEADGFEYSGNSQLPRPKVRVSNVLGTITALLLSLPNGLEGAKVTRIRTLARYLDASNFPLRRNLFTTSSTFSGSWAKGATLGSFFTPTTSALFAPDGTLTATQFVSTPTTSQGLFLRASQSQSANTYTVSVYIYVPTQAGVTNWGLFVDAQDIDAGAAATVQTTFDQWVRVSTTITYTATRSFLDFNIRRNGGAPSASGFTFHVWGAQIEAGTTRTEYQEIGATWSQNPYGTPDPTAEFPREIYYIDRKTAETRDVVEFELAAAFDLVGVRAPKRQCISNICQWKYRSAECGYTGPPIADANDTLLAGVTSSPQAIAYNSAEATFQATIAPLDSARSALNTAANTLNTAQGNWYLAEERFNSTNKVTISDRVYAFWNGSGVTLGTEYRKGQLMASTPYGAYTYKIQRWAYDGTAVATAQTNYNTALATYDSALSAYNSALTARDAALLAWQTAPAFSGDINASGDVCGKRLSSCKLRFGDQAELPFGSFPGIGAYFG